MSQTLTVHLERPVTSVRILDGYGSNAESSVTDGMNPAANVEQTTAQKNLYSDLCRTLQGLIAKVNRFYDEIFAGQKEEIAKLSVEIARKILIQKVQDGDYEIESIVKAALKNAPAHDSLVVHLNPEDLAAYRKAQDDDTDGTLGDIKLLADADIGRAECVLESDKGVIKSLVDEHLKQIEKALKKTE